MLDNFDPQSSDVRDVRVMGARFDGLLAHIDVMGGVGTIVDREGLIRPVSELMATVSIHFVEPETGAAAVRLAEQWLASDEAVRVQTFADGNVKMTGAMGGTIQGACLTPE